MDSRAVRDAVTCDFRPQSGSWYSRCHERATLIKVSETFKSGHVSQATGDYDRRRCARHAAIDIRTAERSDWKAVPTFAPFDHEAERARLVAEEAERARIAKMQEDHRKTVAHLKAILDLGALAEVDVPKVRALYEAYKG